MKERDEGMLVPTPVVGDADALPGDGVSSEGVTFKAKTCTVPLSLDTARCGVFEEKAML